MIKTVWGCIDVDELGVVLPHEHICCFSVYAEQMAGKNYLDKKQLSEIAARYLGFMRENYGLKTLIDCTPLNIGRDVELLKEVSQRSGVNIVCSTGFYYTEESVLFHAPAELLAEYMIADAKRVNAGIIKCAVEYAELSEFNIKLLKASAMAQLRLGLPIVLHTNAKNKNGIKAVELLLSEGVKPQAITVGHLSDTEDFGYLRQIADLGCYIGLDRLYNDPSDAYVSRKLAAIKFLCDAGFEDRILLSHDALFFNGFESEPRLKEQPRFAYCFEHILSELPESLSYKVMVQNPMRMLLACDNEIKNL